MTELFGIDERVDGYEAFAASARELTMGSLLRRIEDNLVTREAAGEFSAGLGYDSNIVSIEIGEDRAIVVDCSQDSGVLYDAEGNVLIPADDFFKIRRSSLLLVGDQWLVEEIYAGGDERCDPEDYQ